MTVFLTPSQISGLRGFLREGLVEFAANVGISNVTLGAIEKKEAHASKKTEEKIMRYAQQKGYEFTNDGGVKPSQGVLFKLRGKEAFLALYDYVYREMSKDNAERVVRVNNTNERKYLGWFGPEADTHSARMVELGVKYHILTQHGDQYAPCEYGEYRWTPKGQFSYASDYVFGNYCAIISFKEDPQDTTIFLIEDIDIAETRKQMIDKIWEVSEPVIDPVTDLSLLP